jgi:hypothetical protein
MTEKDEETGMGGVGWKGIASELALEIMNELCVDDQTGNNTHNILLSEGSTLGIYPCMQQGRWLSSRKNQECGFVGCRWSSAW